MNLSALHSEMGKDFMEKEIAYSYKPFSMVLVHMCWHMHLRKNVSMREHMLKGGNLKCTKTFILDAN